MTNTIHTQEYKEIIKKLRNARIRAGLTQKKVAKLLNKTQSFISKTEKGDQRIRYYRITW